MSSNFEQFSIVWLKAAYKNLEKLPISDQETIAKQISFLLLPHKNNDIKKLKGHQDLYRLRVGNYRIIFSINKKTKQIYISAVGHRREIYSIIGH